MTSPLRRSEISHPTTLTPGAPGWPYGQLDVDDLRARGWRPTAFREFVLKVHQRCNLACDYCYVYELADQTWRDRPALMSRDTWLAAARRIAEHAERHRLARVGVVLHGGEPLLAGTDRLVRLADEVRAAMPTGCAVTVGMQTNGVMLDESTLDHLVRAGISIGVSVDGAAESHDRHRRYRDGRGSHAAVDRALALLSEPRHRSSFAGLLCTVDPDSDPVECYEALLRHAPPSIDVLLPHANWANPPRRPPGRGSTPYADWLIAMFDRWYGAPRQETRVRLFEEVMQLLLGGSSRSEQVGLSPVAVAVVESDGAIEQVDSLKSAYSGACATSLNVRSDTFDAALDHPGVVARQIGTAALCDDCLACPIHQVCGGGHYAHRYQPGTGFRSPSVYCADLQKLIGHVRRRMADDLSRLEAGSGR
ncbi:MAG TPA: FxsB family cyclophane-forming radical SAM/SPASM peptide maturase [Actinoplanes sp.]|nr:FxsB family cyclophane-forming radical SAM/SPASM peptide maturase [Actinoplanes sp.]